MYAREHLQNELTASKVIEWVSVSNQSSTLCLNCATNNANLLISFGKPVQRVAKIIASYGQCTKAQAEVLIEEVSYRHRLF